MNDFYSNPFITKIKLFIIRIFPPKAGKPNKGEQMVRWYGYYCNVSCHKRKERDEDHRVPCLAEAEGSPKEHPKDRVRFVQEVCY
jgi:hypothetical protein